MFKKIKNKIEEEIKQSPLRLSASVQQLAQAISPSTSQSSFLENQSTVTAPLPDALTVSSELFSIVDELDADSNKTLHNVDLTATSPSILPGPRSRRSSLNSVASDVSSLFPIYESPLNHSFLQSECESEIEDGVSTQLEKVSKEQLYQGYKKLLYRYNKYKGRFLDLSRLYKDLQYDNMKTKNVLQESQDKTLRRISELREQCQLEQKAKAHLEESLRNDLEERDHIINTLNTKIGLLKGDTSATPDELLIPNLVDDDSKAPADNVNTLRKQNQELTGEIQKLRKQLSGSLTLTNGPALDPITTEQVKEKITELKSGIVRMKSDNESISNLLSKSPSTSEHGDDSGVLIDLVSPEVEEKDKQRIEKLNNLLLKCKEKISNLNMEIRKKNTEVQDLTVKLNSSQEAVAKLNGELDEVKQREEENVQSIVENKMAIHQELEAKELQIKSLTKDLQNIKTSLQLTQTKFTESENSHKNEIELLRKEITATNNMKKELEEKLVAVKNEALSLSLNNNIDKDFLEEEKNRINSFMETMFKERQEKLRKAVDIVDKKIRHAEGTISRLCSEKLIASRSTEMELLQKIESLENQVQDSGINNVRVEDLEKEIKSLQESLLEKVKIIDDNSQVIAQLNEELNEKIDRIVVLGDELEETSGNLKMQLESSESKQARLTKEKDDLETRCKEIWQKYNSLQDETKALNAEVKNLKEENVTLLKENEQFQITIASLESTSFLDVKQFEELRITLSNLEEELKIERDEKAAAIRHHEESKTKLLQQLQELELNSKGASINFEKVSELEGKLLSCERENENLKLEVERILAEKNSALEELQCKVTSLETDINNATSDKLLEIEKLSGNVHSNEEKMRDLLKKLHEQSEEKESLKLELERVLTEKTETVGELQSKMMSLEKENISLISEKENEIKALNKVLQSKEEDLAVLSKKIQEGDEDRSSLILESQRVLTEKCEKINDLELKVKTLVDIMEEAIAEKSQEIEKLQASIQNKEDEIKTLLLNLQEKTEESESLRTLVEESKKAKAAIEKDFASQLEREVAEKEKSKVDCLDLEKSLAEKQEEHSKIVLDLNEKLKKSEKESAAKFEDVVNANLTLEQKALEQAKLLDSLQNQLSVTKNDNEAHTKRRASVEANLRHESDEKQKLIDSLNERLKVTNSETQRLNSELVRINKQLEEKTFETNKLIESENKLRSETTEYKSKLGTLSEELTAAKSEIATLRKNADSNSNTLKEDCDSKVNILKSEIKFLNDKFQSEMSNWDSNREREVNELNERLLHSENTADELLKKLEAVAAERDELKHALEEKALKASELEGCLSELKSDLDKNFNDKSKDNTTDAEDLYEGKLKKIISDYEVELAKRDDLIRDLEFQVSEQKDDVASLQSLRLEVRNLRKDLKEKDDLIELKLEENVALEKESENRLINLQIDKGDLIEQERHKHEETLRAQRQVLEDELVQQKAEFEKQMMGHKVSLNQEVERIQNEREASVQEERAKFKEKLNELEENFRSETKEWLTQKKKYDVETGPIATEDQLVEDLECTSKIAVAAVESSGETIELLKQKMMLQDEEIKELKRHHKRELEKIVGSRSRSLSEREPEDVEYEYLRNILYEYMMGREQMVLAKVLAAIVKFDQQQTQNVLDRQSSVGQLRIL